MSDYLFKDESAIIAEAEKMFTDNNNDRADRAMISNFYNGGKPIDDAEIAKAGYTKNINFLSGFPNMKGIFDQAKSYLTVSRNTNFELRVKGDGPLAMRASKILQGSFNKMIGKNKKFFSEYNTVCANAVLHGTGIFMFLNHDDIFPVSVTPDNVLVPKGCSKDSASIPYVCITDMMDRNELSDKRGAAGWDAKAIKALLEEKSNSENEQNVGNTASSTSSNEQEEADANAMDVSTGDFSRFKCMVYRFYQASNDGKKVKITVTTRGTDAPKVQTTADSSPQPVSTPSAVYKLYEEEIEGSISDFILGMHIDCSINDRDKWHRVIGFGTIQYPSDAEREFMINRIFESAQDSTKTVYKSNDEANREVTDSIEIRNNAVVPKNLEILDRKNLGKDINQCFQALGYIEVMSEGKTGVAGHTRYESDKETIAVQTERQRINDISKKSSFSDWKMLLDCLGYLIFEKVLKHGKSADSEDYVKDFLSTVGQINTNLDIKISDDNVEIAYKNIIGDGSDVQSKQIYQFLAQNIERLPPEGKLIALNTMAEIASGDQRFADMIAPITDDIDSVPQKRIAQYENSICITQGISPDVSRSDVDMLHVPEHFNAMNVLLQQYAKGFDQKGYMAFVAIGGHIAKHAQNLEAMNQVNAARQIMSALNDVSMQGEQLAKGLMEQQAAGDQPDMEQMLAMEELALEKRKQAFKEYKEQGRKYEFERKQGHREQATDANLSLAARRQALLEDQARFNAMLAAETKKTNDALAAIELEMKSASGGNSNVRT